jgi:hypothetical protein
MENPPNLNQPLALFVPESAGDANALLALTLEAVGQTFPLLSHLLGIAGRTKLSPASMEQLSTDATAKAAADVLGALFRKFGSDKATGHGYHLLYGAILKRRHEVSSVLEIGVGTNNLDVVSNMGTSGVPGASLRAFREFLPNATIFGADADERVLFQEDRIRTYFVDHTDLSSLEALGRHIPDHVDLIVDDGLHSPNANLAVLAFSLGRLKNGGWLVIEDIPERALPLWQVVAALLPDSFATQLLRDEAGLAFVVQRQAAPADSDQQDVGDVLRSLAALHQAPSNPAAAEASLLVHLELYEALGRQDEDVASAYGYLGVLYQTHGDLAQAEVMHKKALQLYEALRRKDGMAAGYANLGRLYQTGGDLAQAAAMYKKSIPLFQQLGAAAQVRQVQGSLDQLAAVRGILATKK